MTSIDRFRAAAGLSALAALTSWVNVVPARAAEPSVVTPDARAEAKARFDRGKRLFEEKDYAGALVEFQRASAMVPSAVTELNIGFVYVQMRRPVEAVDALEAALRAPDLPTSHADVARETLADQQARIGRLDVVANLPAALELDGTEAGRTPLAAPLRASEGLHTLAAIAPGCPPLRREIRVTGGTTEQVIFTLVPAVVAASLVVSASVADAETFVDGVSVGRTPFPASLTIKPGEHAVVLRRDGYVEAHRSITVGPGSAGAVSVELDEDPDAPASTRGVLVLATSEPAVTLTIDGRPRGTYRGERLKLPRGPHHVRAEHAGFVPVEENVAVPAGGEAQARLTLDPTAETYVAYTRAARRQRSLGLVAAIGGLAIGAAAGVLAWHYTGAVNDAQLTIDALAAAKMSGRRCDPAAGHDCSVEEAADYERYNAAEDRRRFAWGGVALGVAALGLGGYLLLTADDPHKYDRAPAETPVPRPSLAPLAWIDRRGGGFLVQARF